MPTEIQVYIIKLAESQLAFEWKIAIERQMKMSDWLARPRPVAFRDVFLSNLNDLFSTYDSFDPRAGGIGCPLRYRPTLFTLESPSLSSRDVNVNRGDLCNEIQTFAKVQAKWGLGALKVKLETCKLKYCPQGKVPGHEKKHMIVSGFYRDEQNVKREMFLGYSFNSAYYRIDDIKRLSLF